MSNESKQTLAEQIQAPIQSLREAVASGNSARIVKNAINYMASIDDWQYYNASHKFTPEQDVAIKLFYGVMSNEEMCDAIGCYMTSLVNRQYLLCLTSNDRVLNSNDFIAAVRCLEQGATIEEVEDAFGVEMQEAGNNNYSVDSSRVHQLQQAQNKQDNQGELEL